MNGKEMCALTKDDFCGKAPVFVGDILWEHLQLLQQECDKDQPAAAPALKYAAPRLSETTPQLPVSPPRSARPFSPPPRTYTNLDQTQQQPVDLYGQATRVQPQPGIHSQQQQSYGQQRYTPSPLDHQQRVSPVPLAAEHQHNRLSPPAGPLDPAARISPPGLAAVKSEYPVKQEYGGGVYPPPPPLHHYANPAQYGQYPPRTVYPYHHPATTPYPHQPYMHPIPASHPYFPVSTASTELPPHQSQHSLARDPRWTTTSTQSYQVHKLENKHSIQISFLFLIRKLYQSFNQTYSVLR